MPNYYVSDVAERTGKTEDMIRAAIRSGNLPAWKSPLGRWVIEEASLKEWCGQVSIAALEGSDELYTLVDAAVAVGVDREVVVQAAMSGVLNAEFVLSRYKWMVNATELAAWAKTMRSTDSEEQCVSDLAHIFNLCPFELKRAIKSHKVIGRQDKFGKWKAHAAVVLKWMQGRVNELKSPDVAGWKELSEQGFLSFKEAADLCGMTHTRLYIAVTEQELKRYYIKSVGRHFLKYEDLQAWMAMRGKILAPRGSAVAATIDVMKANIDRLSSELGEAHGVISMVAGKVTEFAVRH